MKNEIKNRVVRVKQNFKNNAPYFYYKWNTQYNMYSYKKDIDMNIYLFKILELPQRLGDNLPAKQKTQETQF